MTLNSNCHSGQNDNADGKCIRNSKFQESVIMTLITTARDPETV